jgi:hypothetical protein
MAVSTDVKTHEGLAITVLGDTMMTLWQAPARLPRIQWFFDEIEAHAAKQKSGVMLFQIILPTSDPPDGPARAENAMRLRKLMPLLRRVVTVAVGDALRASIVRTILRAMLVVQGQTHVQFVSNTVDEGIKTLLEKADPSTPTAPQIEAAVQSLYRALSVTRT